MQSKFENWEYESITEFVKEFREMLENHLRTQGPEHPVARKAQKMDIMMEQRLILLPK